MPMGTNHGNSESTESTMEAQQKVPNSTLENQVSQKRCSVR